jgi:hypothetical protein
VNKARQKVKERNAIGEITIDDDIGLDTEEGDSRRRSSSGVDDNLRRESNFVF